MPAAGHPGGTAADQAGKAGKPDPADPAGQADTLRQADKAGHAGQGSDDIVALVSLSLRRERARAGVSLTELAKRAGIAKSTLSQLESGAGNPSLETLWALGTALGIPLSRLIDPPRGGVQVIRAGEGVVMHAERDPYEAAMLASCPPGARRDIYRVVARPGAVHLAQAHTPGTMEHLVLGAGRAVAGPEGEAVELGPGDYLRYPGDIPHVFDALEPDTVAIMIMEHV